MDMIHTIPMLVNERGTEDEAERPRKRQKSMKRQHSLNNLHDASSIVKTVRLDPSSSKIRVSNILTKSTVSGDDLAAAWPATWAAFQQRTLAISRRHKIPNVLTDRVAHERTNHASKKK
jgi:hypothetical protein